MVYSYSFLFMEETKYKVQKQISRKLKTCVSNSRDVFLWQFMIIIIHKVLLPVITGRQTIHRFERPRKMKLIQITYHGADLVDWQFTFFQKVGRLGHAVTDQKLLW